MAAGAEIGSIIKGGGKSLIGRGQGMAGLAFNTSVK